MPQMDNKGQSDNILIRDALRLLRERLPSGWDAARKPASGPGAGALLQITSPDGRSGLFAIWTRRTLEPRLVAELAARAVESGKISGRLLLAPHLSPAVRSRLREAGINYLDLTGNIHIEMTRPGLMIQTQGAVLHPDRRSRATRSLRGAKAGRIVRLLVDTANPPGVRELAEKTGVDPGYASRIVALLDREALIERRGYGRIVRVDWQRLLRRWAEDSRVSSRGRQGTCLEPRGLDELLTRCRGLESRYALSGALAAGRLAPGAPPRLAMVYVEELSAALAGLGLREAESGANVLVIEPSDDGVFARAAAERGLWYVAPSQAAADLLTSPGRGPAEAEALIEWMAAHEGEWRG